MKSLFMAAALAVVSASEVADAGLARKVADLWSENDSNSLPKPVELGLSEEEEDDSYTFVDTVRRLQVLEARDLQEQRSLSGAFGSCAANVTIPSTGGLVCDPPNALPQICNLVCRQGYWPSGLTLRGISQEPACADSVCKGTCVPNQKTCTTNELVYETRECSYSRWVECEENESGLCLETVTEPCQYSRYVEKTVPCCELVPVNAPAGCWNSGCTGTCDKPGGFHYYSSRCPGSCKTWQDPAKPTGLACNKCNLPTVAAPVGVVVSNAVNNDPPSQVTFGCLPGYFGTTTVSACMTYDGSFYPPPSVTCQVCSAPREPASGLVERVTLKSTNGNIGQVKYQCVPGYIGEATISTCNYSTGAWNAVNDPDCTVAPSPSTTPTVSITPTPSFDPALATADPTITPTASITGTPTPSVSKSPRPPKVKGSRAPSPAAKVAGSAPPAARST